MRTSAKGEVREGGERERGRERGRNEGERGSELCEEGEGY